MKYTKNQKDGPQVRLFIWVGYNVGIRPRSSIGQSA